LELTICDLASKLDFGFSFHWQVFHLPSNGSYTVPCEVYVLYVTRESEAH